ncbi:MAG: PAS domain S-box protein [Acidobacteriaceae bacterium]|nr:PAS domain S-box protein [Acidobacteriaceae bacterium]
MPSGELSDDAVNSPEQLRLRMAKLVATVEALENHLSHSGRLFFENPVPAILYDPISLRILEANAGALALYESDESWLRNQTVLALTAVRAGVSLDDLDKELARPVNVVGPFVSRGATGREVTLRMIVIAMCWNGADVRMAMLQDETARQLTEERVRASEERYRDLFENANDVIFLQDLKGKILAVNRAAETLTGYWREEVLGQNVSMLVAPEARHDMQDIIRAHLGGGANQHYEVPMISKAGTKRYLEVSTRIIYRHGHPVAVQGIGRDITERKNSEQRLIEFAQELQLKNEELSTALQLAREATQLKEQFLANTSHELRTPMNGIMGMLNLLRDTPLTADQREYVDSVSQCANDLLTIINDLLDVSQIEAGRLHLACERFDPRESLRAVTKILRVKAIAKGLELTEEIATGTPARIAGDSVRFRQVLINLVANAIKFTQDGFVQVRMSLTRDGQQLLCEVVDSGIGVEEAVRDRIFEAFFQADGTLRRRYGGTGLGLTISKQLVELMGGRIGTYNNKDSRGATFWFELPLRSEQPSPDDTDVESVTLGLVRPFV